MSKKETVSDSNQTEVSSQTIDSISKEIAALDDINNTPDQPKIVAATGAQNTVEDLVIQIIKPEIINWLDNNLPSMVKEIVQKEIKEILSKSNK